MTESSPTRKDSFKNCSQIVLRLSGAHGFIRKDMKKEYAAKIICCDDDTKRNDVSRDINICQRLEHRNVVKLVETFFHPRFCVLVFDMVCVGELFDDIAEREKYSEDDACQCIEQILQGVAYLHRNDIIHRDLKPENILLTKTGNDAVVKIAHFGSAVEMKGRKRYKYGKAGTEYYMAPEVHKLLTYDTPVDLWSCGTLLYIMLVGESPSYGKDENLYRQTELRVFKFPNGDGHDAVCNEAKDLVFQLLTFNQDERVAAEDALMHSFIKKRTYVASRFHRRNTVDDLKRFLAHTRDVRTRMSEDFAPSSTFMRSFLVQDDHAHEGYFIMCLGETRHQSGYLTESTNQELSSTPLMSEWNDCPGKPASVDNAVNYSENKATEKSHTPQHHQ